MASTYEKCLTDLNPTWDTKKNSTHLKNRLFLHCPYLTAAKQGRDVLLTYDVGIGAALLNFCYDEDEEAIHLDEAAKIVRKHLFQYGSAFSGSVSYKQLKATVPKTLLALVNMILEGPSIQRSTDKDQEPVANKVSLTIAY